MLFHKGLYDVQNRGEVKIICLRMSDLVKNLRNNASILSQLALLTCGSVQSR